ncbi:disulfide bond formation protein B [Aliikangiella marina]|uniref:Disulfide bond formation protein B n=1 Tax=Aliikangiella marina TaxID=1712262 RepID=A0A545T8X5_9GAMM|nr:disulfide bond formation protein B [Aliikangiella marina]TQV73677.1 disulfide bond formation protein B [Aliikangiella marina]
MFETRGFNLFMAFVCHQLLVAAYYFQYVEGMDPCPLCIFQRIGVLAVGIWFLIRGIHNPLPGSIARPVYASLGLLSAILGGVVSGRHIWLQNLPEGEVPACGPALDYLMEMLPVSEVIGAVLAGDGECAKVSWSLMGISMPGWVLLFFIGVGGLMLFSLYNHFRQTKVTI